MYNTITQHGVIRIDLVGITQSMMISTSIYQDMCKYSRLSRRHLGWSVRRSSWNITFTTLTEAIWKWFDQYIDLAFDVISAFQRQPLWLDLLVCMRCYLFYFFSLLSKADQRDFFLILLQECIAECICSFFFVFEGKNNINWGSL